MSLRLVCATPLSPKAFLQESLLGRCLTSTFRDVSLTLHLFPHNTEPLARCYNSVIFQAGGGPDDTLVFLHDDLCILDLFWTETLDAGLRRFDLVGLAGNTRRLPRQPAWAFVDTSWAWDEDHLSGAVAHGAQLPLRLKRYGAPLQECKLLDGVLLAARRSVFLDHGLRFDERFAFHFYDMDLCREFEAKGLRMGTVPLSAAHGSAGRFGAPEWRAAYRAYLEKWGEPMADAQAWASPNSAISPVSPA
ncbi:hypothetical protein SLNSH_11575 [Alsobacter soli]|uniref:Streptomycin biosynthesis protein StrF domain-containing protein n=1 Tax=Alsobacter soli TaxID=2109933 RepID=A0A2T1HSY4_9HYPH|nr:hypothetical protein SLNSH_11575 [Alsobacter soli]